MHAKYWAESLKGRDHSEDTGVDGSVIFKWISGKELEGVDWVHLPQDRDCWQALVNTALNFQVS
jgi:hypothetical protein